MVSIKSLFVAALCGLAYAAPIVPNDSVRSSTHVSKNVEVFDRSLVQKRSDVVEDSAVAELVARSPTHGTFKLKWTADIGHGQDKVLKCKVKFHDGQVSADGSGVHVSPFASTGNGQGVFRVSYLSSSGGWTAVARINFDATNGRVINAVDEGVEESGQTRASHLDVTFGSGIL